MSAHFSSGIFPAVSGETKMPAVTAMVPAAAEAPVAPVVAPPPASVSLFDLVPAEIGGLPIAAWIGGAVYGLILLLFFGSLL